MKFAPGSGPRPDPKDPRERRRFRGSFFFLTPSHEEAIEVGLRPIRIPPRWIPPGGLMSRFSLDWCHGPGWCVYGPPTTLPSNPDEEGTPTCSPRISSPWPGPPPASPRASTPSIDGMSEASHRTTDPRSTAIFREFGIERESACPRARDTTRLSSTTLPLSKSSEIRSHGAMPVTSTVQTHKQWQSSCKRTRRLKVCSIVA